MLIADCTGVPEWDPNKPWYEYVAGEKVTNANHLWKCINVAYSYHEPSGVYGHFGWSDLGECGSGGPTPEPTPDPTADPTPAPIPIPAATATPVPAPTPAPTATPDNTVYPAWDANTIYVGGDRVSYNGNNWEAKWWTSGNEPGNSSVWMDLGNAVTPEPTPVPTGATAVPTPEPTDTPSDELKISYTTTVDNGGTYSGKIVLENPNTSYTWNGNYFALRSVQFELTSQITSHSSPGGELSYTVEGDLVKLHLGWQSTFPLGRVVEVNIECTKSGNKEFPENFKANYVRGEDIVYPQYAGLPASWSKGKTDLASSDLIANTASYYNTNASPITDNFIMYNPPNATQLQIGQTYSVNYPVNTVDGVRIWIPSKYMAMGLAVVKEKFGINPNYMVALGTKENYAAGVVGPEVGNTSNPVDIDGTTWYWPVVVTHPDGPYQMETGNFNDTRSYFIDYFPPNAEHNSYLMLAERDDPAWVSAGICSAISITVTRETMNAVEVDYVGFMEQAVDPWAEMALVTFGYNRGINAFWAKKLFTDNRAQAIASSDVAEEFGMGGFANHVPTVRAILDQINNDLSDIYDVQIAWADMENFFIRLRMFFANGVPAESDWNAMKADVQRAFNVLASHWGGNTVSLRYDFLTLFRVIKEYLPDPIHPRPTGENWYYQVTNAIP